MKKLIIYFVGIILPVAIFAQNDIFYTEGLSTEQKNLVRKAQSDIQRGDRYYNSSIKIYNQYKSLLESSKRRKQKKGERKTVKGKLNLKQAAYYYDKGYKILFDIYYNLVANINFQLPENQQKAMQLSSQAEALFNQGQKLLKSLQGYSEKDLKKRVKFKKMLTTVDNGKQNEVEAIRKLIQAIKLFNNETLQIQKMRQADDNAWQQALNDGTIDAFQAYLSNFPNGRHVSEAYQKIEELKQKQMQQQVDTTILEYTSRPNLNLVYRVQILADIKPWSDYKIRRKIYPNYGLDGYPTKHLIIGGWHKYYVGEFNTYAQAKSLAEALALQIKTGPFVVAFLNGEPIDIKEALQIEQQLK